ncbi:MAG: hypothetical protein HYY02_07750 [Chloroflexi bacterium]|nr:hypothetical protein [Chloroflexota bacterium]
MAERSSTTPGVPGGERGRRRPRPRGAAPEKRPPSRGPRWALVGLAVALVVGAAAFAFISIRSPESGGPLATLNTQDIHSLAFSPVDPNVAFFGHHDGLLKTSDGGRTWQPLKSERNWDAMGLAVPSGAPDTLYVTGHDVFFRSSDGGLTWQPVRHNLPGTDIHGFAADPEDPQVLFAFVVGGGLFQTRNGGDVWQLVTDRLPQSTMALAVLPGEPRVLLAGTMDSGVLRSADGGANWSRITGFSARAATSFAVAPKTPGLVFAGSEAGLLRSADGGLTWTVRGMADPIMALALSPQDHRLLLAVDQKGRVFRSQDGGESWGGS